MSDAESKTPTYDALPQKDRRLIDTYLSNGMVQWRAYFDVIWSGDKENPNYDSIRANASTKFSDHNIQQAIEERLKEVAMSADEALARLSDIGRATAEDWIRLEVVQKRPKVFAPVAVAIEEKRFEIEVMRETQARLGQDKDPEADRELMRLEQQLVRLEVMQEKDPGRVIEMDGPVEEVVMGLPDLAKMESRGKLHLVKSVKHDKDGSIKVEIYDAESALDKILRAHGAYGAKGTPDDPLNVRFRGVNFEAEDAGHDA